MPIYEYECANCGAVVDLKHAFREAPPTTACSACGASPLKRLFRPAGIVFKGSGFYVNDSRSTTRTKTESSPAADVKSAPAAEGKTSESGAASSPKSADSTGSGPKGDAAA